MTAQSPFYGAKNMFTMNTPAYLQLYTGTINTKPTDRSAALAFFKGTPSSIVITATGVTTASDYFIFNTPQNRYCFYVTTPPSASLFDISIAIDSGLSIASAVAKISAKAKDLDDVLTSYDATTVTITAKIGGLCATNTESMTNATITKVDGAGAWAKIGKLAADLASTPEEVVVTDSEGEDNQVGAKFPTTFSLLNVNQRALEIINADWNNQKVNVAFFDETNDNYPIYILHNINLTALPDFLNRDGARVNFKMNKQYKDWSTSVKFWDYSTEV
jgi:hypothetical protein